MAAYWEKLKDPRWQKKRLDVLNESNFECQSCGEKSKELHVHHPAYVKGREPWEYEADELRVYCLDCHQEAYDDLEVLTELLNTAKMDINISCAEITISGFIAAMIHDGPFDLKVIGSEYADGISYYYKRPYGDVNKAITKDGVIPYSVIKQWTKELR